VGAAWRPDRRVLFILGAAYSVYGVNGILNAEIGPSLPSMVQSFHINLAAAGVIFTAQFIGYLPGAVTGGFAADRWGYRGVLVLAALLTAAGTTGTALVSAWPAALALTLLAGLGFGITDSLGNAVVAAQAPREGGVALNILHTFFGVGALCGPLIVAAMLGAGAGWHGAFFLTGALAVCCAALFWVAPIPPPAHSQAAAPLDGATPGPRNLLRSLFPDRRIWLIACMLFLFVGIEQLTGGWISTYLQRVLHAHQDASAGSASLYWAAVTAGRIAASVAALRLSNERILGGSMVLALAALLLMGQAGSIGGALAALAAVGFGFAAIYPTIMAITARAYPLRFATLVGGLVAAGGLGGMLFPVLGGVVGQASGLHATLWLDTLAAAVLLACFILYLLLYARRTAP
jgi:FHS family glucose/mannose:H+ symporter-like MFS transporter